MTLAPTASARDMPRSASSPESIDVYDWLLNEGRHISRTRDLIAELSERLVAAGMPLCRVSVNIRTIHPQILATAYAWRLGAGAVELQRGHDIINDPAYVNSPFKVIHDGAGGSP